MNQDELTIFDFAPNELTQDAFLLWLFHSWNAAGSEDETVKKLAKKMLQEFVCRAVSENEKKLTEDLENKRYEKIKFDKNTSEKTKQKRIQLKKQQYEYQKSKNEELKHYIKNNTFEIKELSVEKQYKKIDVLIWFKCGETELALVIEDKVDSATHDQGKKEKDQLEVYRNCILEAHPKKLFLGIYYKNRKVLEKECEYVRKYGYAPFTLDDIVQVLGEDSYENIIIESYRMYINRIRNMTYPEYTPETLLDVRMNNNDAFKTKLEKRIFWDSFFTYFAEKFLDLDQCIRTCSANGHEIELKAKNYYFKERENVLCECALESHKRYFFCKIYMADFPLAVEFRTNDLSKCQLVLYQMGKPETEVIRECRKTIYETFLNWLDRQNPTFISCNRKDIEEINIENGNGYFQEIASLDLTKFKFYDDFTCQRFEENFVTTIIDLLAEIRGFSL